MKTASCVILVCSFSLTSSLREELHFFFFFFFGRAAESTAACASRPTAIVVLLLRWGRVASTQIQRPCLSFHHPVGVGGSTFVLFFVCQNFTVLLSFFGGNPIAFSATRKFGSLPCCDFSFSCFPAENQSPAAALQCCPLNFPLHTVQFVYSIATLHTSYDMCRCTVLCEGYEVCQVCNITWIHFKRIWRHFKRSRAGRCQCQVSSFSSHLPLAAANSKMRGSFPLSSCTVLDFDPGRPHQKGMATQPLFSPRLPSANFAEKCMNLTKEPIASCMSFFFFYVSCPWKIFCSARLWLQWFRKSPIVSLPVLALLAGKVPVGELSAISLILVTVQVKNWCFKHHNNYSAQLAVSFVEQINYWHCKEINKQ